jgi:nucleoid-associated protein YejK
MRDITDIQIDELIMHIVDPIRKDADSKREDGEKEAGRSVFSKRTLPLEENPEIAKYFVSHILASLRDSAAKAARFNATGECRKICTSLLNGGTDLVSGSKQLAENLCEIITRDCRISSGDLVVCFFREKGRPNRYLSLIKLDPSEVFRHVTLKDDQSREYVSFQLEKEIMPTTRERLQKCAFIRKSDPGSEYDMILLDRQIKQLEKLPIARFFVEDFLGAELALDAKQRTDRLYTSFVRAQNDMLEKNEITAAKYENLTSAINNVMVSDHINIATFIDSLDLPETQREKLLSDISEDLPDQEFEVDHTYAQEKIKKRVYRGSYGLKVEINDKYYDEVIVKTEKKEEPGKPPYYEVVIHTKKWEMIPK